MKAHSRENDKYRILIVEDEELLGWCLGFELEHRGFEVRRVDKLDEALGAFEEFKADLCVYDQMFPSGTSLEVLRHCHSMRPDVPAILITAYTPPTEEEMRGSGIHLCLRKPFALEALIDAIAQVREPLSLVALGK